MDNEFRYHERCYIDGNINGRPCTGARFSFCDSCRQVQKENADEIKRAKKPPEVTAAHISHKDRK